MLGLCHLSQDKARVTVAHSLMEGSYSFVSWLISGLWHHAITQDGLHTLKARTQAQESKTTDHHVHLLA